ncbi:NAD(P)-bd-dom domain-containing protein [Fusarium keratoplasticum]|uniref:NAD(P)-bd-dom domain-containing protein n=1 Tax=Fusarium keratoplasticum TaxID=1328300 RepID=A0ACC0QPG3_9HYPO|nr:NAD(P)-bd-dom domain-containing protein [Fusarium keratoplasticum]KAI8663243.1 NAD(P)-bd-dom domain-containing protein [Fusarium keratoplasticum]KAI8663936.1 NAD(P)-bd-dom domain-containing protein [Fusarium keratoplasticum]
MYAILGAAGKVGFATSSALRKAGVPVRAILRDVSKAAPLRELGCEIAVADLQDSLALAKAIGDADIVQIILPPSPQAEDTAEEMRRAIESLAAALEEARPKRVLAISDYGAHIVHDIGMPTMCRNFEERLRQLDCQKVFLRSAEHMQGWGHAIPAAIESGTLLSFHDPVDMLFPTISAPDLGLIAADILLQPPSDKDVEVVHAEGPCRYSAKDVAMALGKLLGRTFKVEAVPRSQWKDAFERVMSVTLAELSIKANDAQNEGGLVDVEPNSDTVRYGTTELIDALRPLLASQ